MCDYESNSYMPLERSVRVDNVKVTDAPLAGADPKMPTKHGKDILCLTVDEGSVHKHKVLRMSECFSDLAKKG